MSEIRANRIVCTPTPLNGEGPVRPCAIVYTKQFSDKCFLLPRGVGGLKWFFLPNFLSSRQKIIGKHWCSIGCYYFDRLTQGHILRYISYLVTHTKHQNVHYGQGHTGPFPLGWGAENVICPNFTPPT